ncbi:MAG: ribosomal protein S18-alanine N-acetyltransferase [Clostridia bacterium]
MNFIEMSEKYIDDVVYLENQIFSEPYTKETLQNLESLKIYDFFLYFDEKVIGYAVISSVLDESELLRIGVLENYRRKNIADTILKKVVEACLERNIKKIHLEVRESNEKAISLYKKNGFLNVGTRKSYYINPKEDAILMTLEV